MAEIAQAVLTKDRTRARTGSLRISTIGVALIVFAGATDIAFRFLPPGWYTFHSYETAYLYATAEGPLRPNLAYRNDRAWGNLANMGNFPGFRQFRNQIFTTDSRGYRNQPGSDRAVSAILIGDSLGLGDSVSDQETLDRQLNKLGGMSVYNGAGRRDWRTTITVINRLNMRGGLVIWQESEVYPLPDHVEIESDSPRGPSLRTLFLAPDNPVYRELKNAKLYVHIWAAYSPLNIVMSKLYRNLCNDVLLPNPGNPDVLVRSLQNGDQMLVLKGGIENYVHPRSTQTSFFAELNSLVKATGNQLLVVLVPDKVTVYGPWFADPPARESSDLYMNSLEKRINSDRIPVVNLINPLRAQAADGLPRHEYNYWLDDTHWNAAGIRRSAEAIVAKLEDLGSISPHSTANDRKGWE